MGVDVKGDFMEQLIEFNGLRVLLTTGQTLSEVQNFEHVADLIISVYPHAVSILRSPVKVSAGQNVEIRSQK